MTLTSFLCSKNKDFESKKSNFVGNFLCGIVDSVFYSPKKVRGNYHCELLEKFKKSLN
jgi:hypothetical protein